MLLKLKPYIATFALFVFLYPMVVQFAHTIEHRNDFHCLDYSTTHLHKAEHHCFICDYIPSVSNILPVFDLKLAPTVDIKLAFPLYQQIIVVSPPYQCSLRAPPSSL